MNDPRKVMRSRIRLAILMPLAVLTILCRMVLFPLLERNEAVRSGFEILNEKLQTARPVLDAAPQSVEEELRLNPRLNKILQLYVFESEDQLTEVNLKLDDFARTSGMSILSIRPTKLTAGTWMENREKGYAFKPLCVTVNGAGNYDQIHRFIGLVERDNPFATLSQVSIYGIKEDPNDLTTALQIEWPMWTELGRTEYLPLMKNE